MVAATVPFAGTIIWAMIFASGLFYEGVPNPATLQFSSDNPGTPTQQAARTLPAALRAASLVNCLVAKSFASASKGSAAVPSRVMR
jgi:hypothetical protein